MDVRRLVGSFWPHGGTETQRNDKNGERYVFASELGDLGHRAT